MQLTQSLKIPAGILHLHSFQTNLNNSFLHRKAYCKQLAQFPL